MEQRFTAFGQGRIIEVERGRKYRIRFKYKDGVQNKWFAAPQKTVRGNKALAQAELVKYIESFLYEKNHPSSSMTVAAYARDWQNKRKELDKVSKLTYNRDEIEIRRIEEAFSNLKITELTPFDIEAAIVNLKANGLSRSALHKFYSKLSQICKDATRKRIIPYNPCQQMDSVKRPKDVVRKSLSEEQAVQLAKDLRDEPRNGKLVVIWLALALGLRRGEALGLRWGDVDLDNGAIHIVNQRDSYGDMHEPKCASQRTLALDAGTVRYLSDWKKMTSIEFCQSENVPDDSPVCCNDHGDYIDSANFDRWRRRYFADHGLAVFTKTEEYVDANGIKRYRRTGYSGFSLHELRHTHATLLIGSGADIKTVQTRMGHSSAKLTLDTYTHPITSNDRQAAETFGRILNTSE